MKRYSSLLTALIAIARLSVACSTPNHADAGSETSGGDVAAACAAYCRTLSTMCSTSASDCEASCMCRAATYPSCQSQIATYADCASRVALLDCTSGDPVSMICDSQRTLRDNCIMRSAPADAGPACMPDAGPPCGAEGQPCCDGFAPCNIGYICGWGMCRRRLIAHDGEACAPLDDCFSVSTATCQQASLGTEYPAGMVCTIACASEGDCFSYRDFVECVTGSEATGVCLNRCTDTIRCPARTTCTSVTNSGSDGRTVRVCVPDP